MRQPPISGWTVAGALLGIGIGLLIAQYFIDQGVWLDDAIAWGRFAMVALGIVMGGGLGAGAEDL